MTPVELEATDAETVTVTYKENSYTFPADLEDVDGDVLDAIDDQKLSHALRALLGADEWKRFKATKPRVSDYNGLFGEYARAIGLGSAGE